MLAVTDSTDGARRTPQHTAAVPDSLWEDALKIARLRGERDALGHGLSVVVRRNLRRYVERHRHLLPPA